MGLVKDILCGEETPYEVFRLGTDARHQDIAKAIKDNLKQIGVQKAQSESRRLRLAEERVVVDLLYYLDEEALKNYRSGWKTPGARSKVIEGLLARLVNGKASWTEVHALAVMSLWGSHQFCVSGNVEDNVFRTWDIAVGSWMYILHSENFWKEWISLRCPVYEIDQSKITIQNVREVIMRCLRENLLKWTKSLPEEDKERMSAVLDFEDKCTEGLKEVVFPFIKYIHGNNSPPDFPLELLSPTFATICCQRKVLDEMMTHLQSTRPSKGRIPMIRWQLAIDHLIILQLGLIPAVRPMLALVKANRPALALAYGEKLMASVTKSPDEDAGIRYTAALAFTARANEGLVGGLRQINQVIDNLEQALLIFDRIEEKFAKTKSNFIIMLLDQVQNMRKKVVREIVENSLNAARTFQETASEDSLAGVTKALNTLLKTHRILTSSSQKGVIEKDLLRSIAHYYVVRCTVHIDRREGELAIDDLKAAKQYDPENPVIHEILSAESPYGGSAIVKELLASPETREER